MSDEQREHLRLPLATRVFIELRSPSLGGTRSGEIVMCETQDVSRGGVQVGLRREVVVGSILQIGVQLPDAKDALYLAGKVEWCLPREDREQQWSAGFKVMNANNSDIDTWVSLLSDMDS